MQWYYVHAVDRLVGLTAIEIAFNDDLKVGLSISHHPFHVRSNAWLYSAYKKLWLKAIANSPKAQTQKFHLQKPANQEWKRGESLHRGRISTKVDWQMRAQIGRITSKAHISASLKHQLGNQSNFQVRLIWYKITGLSKSNSLEPPFFAQKGLRTKKLQREKHLNFLRHSRNTQWLRGGISDGVTFCLTGRQVTTTWIV